MAGGVAERVQMTKSAALAEGALVGLASFAVDWVASGVHRTPAAIVVCSLVLFLAGGLAAGLAGGALGVRGAAAGTALGGVLLVHGLALVSKETAATIGIQLLAVLTALVFGALAALAWRRSERDPLVRATLLAAAVPAASLAWWAGSGEPRWVLGSISVALLPAGALAFVEVGARTARLAALLAVLLLALPVALRDREPERRFVPRTSGVEAPANARSAVLVLVDTLRADHFGDDPERYGTRTLHGLARDGVRFTQAVSAASWTLPATSSILTSLYPSQHGAVMASTALPGDVTTLAEVFHAAGYETAAFTGGAFVSPAFGLDQGFEYFDHLAEFRFRPFRVHVPLAWRVAKNRYLPLRPLLSVVNEFGGMRTVRERVEEWLAARDTSRPFLLLVHTYQVHDYYIYHPDPDDGLRAGGEELSAAFAGRLSVHPSELARASQADLDWFQKLYERRLAHVDRELGLLLESLREHVGEDLAVALTSDHGEGFDAARNRVHHGERLHDDLLRVPLVISAPGLDVGRTVDAQVRTIDVMPTLLELCGIAAPEGIAGTSLLGGLAGGRWPERAFGEERNARARRRALRTAEWKLIDGTDGSEVYDLARDALEAHPLHEGVPGRLVEFLAAFEELYPERELHSTDLDEATLDHLRDLGYIE